MDKNIDFIGEELFNKIRGRFPEVTIGDESGNVTNNPKEGRYFDFEFKPGTGSINVELSQEGLNVMYAETFLEDQTSTTKKGWYSFLKELRQFARKRLMNFDVRNITKSNLDKRDYKFMSSQHFGDQAMTESKLYGTARNSYQDVGMSRIHLEHTRKVNQDLMNSRTQNIKNIYIENAEGERFKYPYKHLNGARAMARHMSEGGHPFDDFGKHITGLSEELGVLGKFKTYVSKSKAVTEGMKTYHGLVKERIQSIKRTLESIQREYSYKHITSQFVAEELTEVPEDISVNWIDQLTVKQFDDELKEAFPYLYRLVAEAPLESIGPDDLVKEEPTERNRAAKKSSSPIEKFEAWAQNKVDKAVQEFEDDDVDESGLQYHIGKKKYGKDGMKKLAQAGRDGANQEELGRIKDRHTTEKLRDLKKRHHHKSSKFNPVDDELVDHSEEKKIPVTEFILSYYDKETGQFPKGETAVLTAVEKDYGPKYIERANKFISAINEKFKEYHTRSRGEFVQDSAGGLNDIIRLSGIGA